MAELLSGFFNAVLNDGVPDRKYTAQDVNDFFKGLVSDSGIYATQSDKCQVVANNGMEIVVKTGRGKCGSNWFEIDSDTILKVGPSDVVLNRIDRVVIKRDLSNRNVELYIKTGTLATNPTPPALERTETVYEIALANITVGKNITKITASMIEDLRSNTSVCGWIVGLINEFDTTTLFNQYKDAQNNFINETEIALLDFETWFETVKNTVKATSLYSEYKYLYATVASSEKIFNIPSSLNYSHNAIDVLEIRVDGKVLANDEFTINSTGTQVTLTRPITTIGTRIEMVNKKSIEGTVSESTVLRVDELERKVDAIGNYVYETSGNNDNVTLSNMVKNFLDGVGEFAGVIETSQLYISVSGTLGIEKTIGGKVFDFDSETTSNRRVIVDFARATIPPINLNDATIAIMSATEHTQVKHATIKATQNAGQTMYVLYGGKYDNCSVNVEGSDGTLYGAYDCTTVTDVGIIISKATGTVFGAYECYKLLHNRFRQNRGVSIKSSDSQHAVYVGNIVQREMELGAKTVEAGNLLEP